MEPNGDDETQAMPIKVLLDPATRRVLHFLSLCFLDETYEVCLHRSAADNFKSQRKIAIILKGACFP